LLCVRSKTKGEVLLDDNQTRISALGAPMSPARVHGSPHVEEKLQLHPRQGCHPVEHEPHETAIAHGGNHARRELLSGLRQIGVFPFGA
jgi:hypothetical protein